jgi:hypothetical protein
MKSRHILILIFMSFLLATLSSMISFEPSEIISFIFEINISFLI